MSGMRVVRHGSRCVIALLELSDSFRVGTRQISCLSPNGRNRRIFLVAAFSGEDLLTEPQNGRSALATRTGLHAPFRPSAGLHWRLPNSGKAIIRLMLAQR